MYVLLNSTLMHPTHCLPRLPNLKYRSLQLIEVNVLSHEEREEEEEEEVDRVGVKDVQFHWYFHCDDRVAWFEMRGDFILPCKRD